MRKISLGLVALGAAASMALAACSTPATPAASGSAPAS